VEFIAFPIGHAGTTLTSTLTYLTTAFSIVRPQREPSRANGDATAKAADHTARAHDYNLFKTLFNALTDLAQSRLLGIIQHRKRSVASLPGSTSRYRAHSDAAPEHTQGASPREEAGQTHRTRTTRDMESMDIDQALLRSTSIGTTHTRKRTLEAVGEVSRYRAHSVATPTSTQAVAQRDTATHTHRTNRVPENTAII
jgi:hypothetical protein